VKKILNSPFAQVVTIIAFCLPAVWTLFTPGAFTSHDLLHNVRRLAVFDRLIHEGQIPPRWASWLYHGWGYPLFNYIYPLPSALGELFVFFGMGYVDSVKILLFLSVPFSAVGMYMFLKAWLPSRFHLVSIAGSIIYIYSPVRFINLYVSASLGACISFALLPWLLWSLFGLLQNKKSGLFSPLLLAALLLMHNVSALIFLPPCFILLFFLQNTLTTTEIILRFITPVVIGIILAAFFLFPAIIEKPFTRYDKILLFHYQDQFPSFKQILYSPWGYGLSNPDGKEDGMSFQLGIANWFGLLSFSIIVAVNVARKNTKNIRFEILLLLLSYFSIFLALKISKFLWEAVPLIQMVQYPHRFLGLATLLSCLATAYTASLLTRKRQIVFCLLILTIALYANRNHLRINETVKISQADIVSSNQTTTSWDEHLPTWAVATDVEAPPDKISLIFGRGEVTDIVADSTHLSAQLLLYDHSQLRLNQFYFPTWVISINGKAIGYQINDPSNPGFPVFSLPPGNYHLSASLTDTPTRKISNYLSIAGSLLYIFWLKNARVITA